MIAEELQTYVRLTPRDVDAAVRAVLAELFPPVSSVPAMRRDEEVFAGRLFSQSHAEKLPASLRSIRIVPGTVITPLARDFLKRRGIEIQFGSRSAVEAIRNQGEWGFAIVMASLSGVVEAWRRSVLEDAANWNELGHSLEDATRWVSGRSGRGALVLAEASSLAVFLACRVPGIRAATANEPDGVARAVRAIGVNLLVVEPVGKSIALLKQMGNTFRRAGGPVVPATLAMGVES